MRGAKLERATLSGAILMDACAKPLLIAGDHRCRTDFMSARLDHANLLRANLTMALLEGADLTNADVRRADLSGASLCRATLTGVELHTAALEGADLTNAIGITMPLLALSARTGVRLAGSPFATGRSD